jgi:GT2 family glycosyltransferase
MNAPVCLIIGDDIFASSDFVKTHLQLHKQRPEIQVACLGLTRWKEGPQATKFMRWLQDDGVQFFYGELLRGEGPTWRHFYTSNLSVKTELLRRFPFNECFPHAAMEDIELGFRIHKQHGLELIFLPDALAIHDHPTTFRDVCRRMLGVGRSTRLFHELWPEQLPPPSPWTHRLARAPFLSNPWLIPPLLSFADVLTRYWCPNPFSHLVLSLHYSMGYGDRTPLSSSQMASKESAEASSVTGT